MKQAWMKLMVSGMVGVGVAMLVGCDSGGGGSDTTSTASTTATDSSTPTAQVGGTWTGDVTYQVSATGGISKQGSDTASITVVQNGTQLSGEIDGYAFTGTVTGNNIALTAPTYKIQGVSVSLSATATFDGTYLVNVSASGKAKEGPITVATGSLHSDRLTRQ